MIFATVKIRHYWNISAKVWQLLKNGKCGLIYLLFVTCLWCWDPSISFLKIVIYRFDSTLTFCEIRFKVFLMFFFSSFSTPISICLWRMLTSHVKLLSFSPLTLRWLPFVYLVSILLSSLNSSTTSSFHHFVSVFSWNKFWTEKENNFHFLKRGYFLSLVKRCHSFISKGNRLQSFKSKFISDRWIDFVILVILK